MEEYNMFQTIHQNRDSMDSSFPRSSAQQLAASPMHQRPLGPGCEWGPQREWSHDPTPSKPVCLDVGIVEDERNI